VDNDNFAISCSTEVLSIGDNMRADCARDVRANGERCAQIVREMCVPMVRP
jgi:hypothetical protein